MLLNPSYTTILNTAIADVTSVLTTFATDPLFAEKFTLAFGTTISSEQFLQTVAALPPIEVLSDAELQGALGAFSLQTQKIYLSESLLKGDLVRLRSVLIEEIGHFVDAQVNSVDSPGDEGAIFAALVLGQNLSSSQLAQLKAENDHGIINLNGQDVAVEKATTSEPYLVADINQNSFGSNPSNFIRVGGVLYFTADDDVNGWELWKTDPTTGVVTLLEINPGSGSSNINYLTDVNGTLYFQAYDNTNGYELWKVGTNGTPTRIDLGSGSSSPSYLTNVNGTLYFTATGYDGAIYVGNKIWKIDPTTGTSSVIDVASGDSYSNPYNLINANGVLYFVGANSNGYELWKVDSTTGSPIFLKDIYAGGNSSSPGNLTYSNGKLYFTADNYTQGTELWQTDGTSTGTVLTQDINTTTNSSSPSNFITVGGVLYFTANDDINGTELWKTDPTTGVVTLLEIRTGSSSSNINYLTDVNGTLYFQAYDNTNGYELWKVGTNGTPTRIDLGSGGSSPNYLTNVNGTLYFTATGYNGTTFLGNELWKIDPTTGTPSVIDIVSGSGSSYPSNLTNINGILYFQAYTPATGSELWKVDPANNLPVLISDLNPGTGSSSPTNFINSGGTVYFIGNNGANGSELFRINPTTGTPVLLDIRVGANGSNPTGLIDVNGTLYFKANDGISGTQLWKIDPTTGTPVKLTVSVYVNNADYLDSFTKVGNKLYFRSSYYNGDNTIYQPLYTIDSTTGNPVIVSGISYVQSLTNINGILYLQAYSGTTGYELWKIDPTTGTPSVIDIVSGTGSSSPTNLTDVNGTLFFQATNSANGQELWKLDSTGNPVLVKDIRTGTASSSPSNLFNVNGTLYFTADNGINGVELWKSDGTTAGTVLAKDINGRTPGSNPTGLIDVNGTLYFKANDGINGTQLWKIDPTTGTPVKLAVPNLYQNNADYLDSFTKVGNKLYFRNSYYNSDTTIYGALYTIDSTTGNPVMVEGISYVNSLTNINGILYLQAYSGTTGTELWKIDPTTGTPSVIDIVSGTGSSSPTNLTDVNGTLFFQAYNDANGYELWKLDSTGNPVLVKDIRTGTGSSSPSNLFNVNGTLYFTADNGINGLELWKSDGTTAGTVQLEIYAGANGSSVDNFINVGSVLYFTANNATSGTELWRINTTTGNPEVLEIQPGSASSSPTYLTNVNGTLYFRAYDNTNGYELWKVGTNGTPTRIDLGSGSSSPNYLTNVNGTLYFTATGYNGEIYLGNKIWKIDATTGTPSVIEAVSGDTYYYPQNLINANGVLYFVAYDNTNGYELWKVDATTSTPIFLKDIYAGVNSSSPTNLTYSNGKLYFTADNYSQGIELWQTDGTSTGTVLTQDINTTTYGSNPSNFIKVGGVLYFTADDDINGRELWKADPVTGVVTLLEINPSSSSTYISYLTDVNGTLYFQAYDNTNGYELWKVGTNGTPTRIDLGSGGSSPNYLTNVNGTLYFTAGPYNGTTYVGNKIWKIDATTGTPSVIEAVSGDTYYNPYNLINANGVLYFVASGNSNGYELWKVDPTTGSPIFLKDIYVGSNSSSPGNLTYSNGKLYFTADNGTQGIELWAVNVDVITTVGNITKNSNEDQTVSFTATDFSSVFVSGSPLTKVKILLLPSNGVLKLGTNAVTANQEISVANLGSLTFVPNANFNGTVGFTWNGSDGTTFAPAPSTVTLTINSINDVPTVANPIADVSIYSDRASNFGFSANTFQDADLGDTLSYSATLADGSPLPSWLSLSGDRTFSSNPSSANAGEYEIKVTAKDQSNATVTDNFILNVLNSAPTNIYLSNNTIPENSADNTPIATLSSEDSNTNNTHSYTLINDAGGRFKLNGNQLVVANTSLLDYEAATQHTIRIKTTDSTGLTYERDHVIYLGNVNDSFAGTLSFSSPTFSVNENGTAVTAVTIQRTGGSEGTVSANIALSNGTATYPNDYSTTSVNVLFANGETSKIVTIPIFDDNLFEDNETLNLTLVNPTGGANLGTQTTAVLTIVDNELPSISVALTPNSVAEDGLINLVYTFTRTGSLGNALTVNFNVSGNATFNTDYSQTGATSFNGTSGTLTFVAGSNTATLTIDPTADTLFEQYETVSLTLVSNANYSIGTTGEISGTITNDDLPQRGIISLNSNNYTVNENETANITLTRSSGLDGEVSVTLIPSNGTATSSNDYNNAPITVTFADGENSKIVTIPIFDDNLYEADETINLTLVNPTGDANLGTQTTAVLTIVDNDNVPDLIVSNITAPVEVISGQSLEISWTVKNQGVTAATGTWYDYVYLQNQNGGQNYNIGTFEFVGSLAVGASIDRSQTITLPIQLQGNYKVVVTTDYSNSIREGIQNESNNTTTDDRLLQVKLAPIPNLQVSSVTAPLTAFSSQSTAIQWTVKNVGNGATSSPYWGDAVYLSLDNTFDNTDIYLGQANNPSYLNAGDSYTNHLDVTLPRGISGSYYFLVQTDIYNNVFENDKENDNLTVGGPTNVSLTPPPDFQVTNVTTPSQAFSGQSLNLSWTVTNQGLGKNRETSWYDQVFMSTDEVLDAGDRNLGTFYQNGTLNSDGSYTSSQTVSLPIGISGDYYFFVRTDAGNQVYENVFESNNTGHKITPTRINLTPPPDLEISALTAPTQATASRALNFSYQVTNFGSTTTPNYYWADRFYLSLDNQLDLNTDLRIGDQSHYGSLAPDESYTSNFSYILPNTLTGNYYLFGVTDSNNEVFELNNENNTFLVATPIVITSKPADLIVVSVAAPTKGEAGKALRVEWTVRNQGTGDTVVSNWTDRVILSKDAQVGNSDDIVLGEFSRGEILVPNQSYTRSELVTLPVDAIAGYQVFVVTDAGNSVYEATQENNNVSTGQPLTVTRDTADLQVTQVSSPSSGQSGQALTVNWTVKNFGSRTTNSNYWYDGVYLSTNNQISSDDIFLGYAYRSEALDASEQYSVSRSFNLPNNLQAGNYYTLVRADVSNYVYEGSLENNNDKATQGTTTGTGGTTGGTNLGITASPDLVMVNVDAPITGIGGQNLTVSWTVRNAGTVETGDRSWYEAFYLSRDQVFDLNSDTYLGYSYYTGNLAAGATYSQTESFRLPQGISGSFYLFAKTDAGNSLYEGTAENNNVAYDPTSVVVSLAQPADLVAGTITIPANGVTGQSASITYTVTNEGSNAVVGNWSDSLYLSKDGQWDINDLFLGQVENSVEVLSGNSYTNTLTASLPGVVSGDYQVIIRSDIRNQIPESNESNNLKATLDKVNVDVERLTLGTPSTGTLAQGQGIYYRFEVGAGETLRLKLDSVSTEAANELYLRYGEVPTRSAFDLGFSEALSPDQDIIVPETQAGTYYVLAYGQEVPIASNYEIKAEKLEFSLVQSQSYRIGNQGLVTLKIRGAKLTPSTNFFIDNNGTSIAASKIFLEDSSTAYVTFDVKGTKLGTYNLRATTSQGNVTTLASAVEVVTGSGADLVLDLTGPSSVRPNRLNQMNLLFGNGGDSDLTAPLLLISTTTNTPFGLAQNQLDTKLIQIFGSSEDGPSNIIRPASSFSEPLFFSSSTTAVNFIVSSINVNDSRSIDWNLLETSIRPSGLSNAEWSPLLDQLKSFIGSTWGDYVKKLNDAAQRLSERGEATSDVDKLFSFVYQEATGGNVNFIGGKLVDPNTGTSISSAVVLLEQLNTSTPIRGSATTDKNGNFQLGYLAAGTYRLSVAASLTEFVQVIVPEGKDVLNFALQASVLPETNLFAGLPISDEAPVITVDSGNVRQTLLVKDGNILHSFFNENTGNWTTPVQIPGATGARPQLRAFSSGNNGNNPNLIAIWRNTNDSFFYSVGTRNSGNNNYQWTTGSLITGQPQLANGLLPFARLFIQADGTPAISWVSFADQGNRQFLTSWNGTSWNSMVEVNSNLQAQSSAEILPFSVFADDFAKQAGSANPNQPQPITPNGSLDYYKQRYQDFLNRNSGQTPPDYYLDYGDKYVNRFTTKTRPDLSPEGQAWLDRARENLQKAIEEKRASDPEGFAQLERNPDAFRDFAYGTHPDAYWNAGLGDLPPSDLFRIGLTPDFKDLLSREGLDQVLDIGDRILNYKRDKLDDYLKNKLDDLLDNLDKAKDAIIDEIACILYDDCPDPNLPNPDPDPNDPDRDPYNPPVVFPRDPNDIIGPTGFGEEKWTSASSTLPYTIRFENQSTATAPAQTVTVTHPLDTDLDLRTFRLSSFGWGGLIFDVPANTAFYNQRLDLTATRGYFVDVTAGIDLIKGEAFWTVTTIDPNTGDITTDALTGFLPPNNADGIGDGFVNYTIRAKRDVTTGTVIDAKATIIFDTEAPIDTPPIFNTLDAGKPTSTVNALPTNVTNTEFVVNWTGNDDSNGSALANYTVYVSDNNGEFTPWLTDTTLTEATYIGQTGHTYGFYSIAKDNAGNTQTLPDTAQATIIIGTLNTAPTITSGLTANFAENSTGIAYTVTATDAEGTTPTYGLLDSDADASLFNINSTTGAITFKTAPDFETPLDKVANNTYNLTVTANDGSLTSSKAVAITVTDLNEIKGNPLINNGRNPIVGTAGPDYLTGGAGAKTLTGGGGNDSFAFTDMRDVGQRIADFTVGEDKLVFTQLFSSLGYKGSNPIADGYIKFVQGTGANSAHTFLQIDRDGLTGSAIARNFLQVDNITPTLLNNSNNFQF